MIHTTIRIYIHTYIHAKMYFANIYEENAYKRIVFMPFIVTVTTHLYTITNLHTDLSKEVKK